MKRFDFARAAKRWGGTVTLPNGAQFYAFVHPLRYKSRMYLEPQNNPIGSFSAAKYLYIGPPEHDITQLLPQDTITVSGEEYSVLVSEPVWFADRIGYYRAILSKRRG